MVKSKSTSMRSSGSGVPLSGVLAILLVALVATASWMVPEAAAQQTREQAAAAAAEQASGRDQTELGQSNVEFIEKAARQGAEIMANPGLEEEADFFKQQEAVDRYTQEHRQWLEQQVERTKQIARGAIDQYGREQGIQAEQAVPDGPYFIVFVSQSMGAEGLRQAFAYGIGRKDVAFAFIGYRADQTHMSFFTALQKIIGVPEDEEDVPSVMLNPPAFTENSITRVPAIVKFDPLGNPIAKAEGVANPEWLDDRISRGLESSYGVVGETHDIAEENLIAVMKQRAAEFDHEAESRKAAERYFEEIETIGLPYAKETRRREMLAQMVVQEDVVDHEGVVRHRAGEVLSMVDEMPMAPVLVIFNSQDPYHVEFAKSILPRYPDRNVILMTTDVNRASGFTGYIQQEAEIGRPVYLLTREVQSTFRIEAIPTLVTPLEDRFAIVEVPLEQGEVSHGTGTQAQAR